MRLKERPACFGVWTIALLWSSTGPLFAADDLGSLVGRLDDKSWAIRIAAANKLGEIHPAPKIVVPLLANKLIKYGGRSAEEDQFDVAIVSTLTKMGPDAKAAVPVLARECNPSFPGAVGALRAICPGHAAEISAIESLESNQFDDRRRKAGLLALLYSDPQTGQALQWLIEGLKHPSPEVRRAACEALGNMELDETEPAIKPLMGLIHDENSQVRAAAAHTLGMIRIGWREDTHFDRSALLKSVRENIVPSDAEATVVSALADPEIAVRVSAAHALQHNGPEIGRRLVPALIEGLKSNDEHLKRLAVDGLAELGPLARDAVPALRSKILDNKEASVLIEATAALTHVASAEEGVSILLEAGEKGRLSGYYLYDPLATFGSADPRVVPFLIDKTASTEPDPTQRRWNHGYAVKALGKVRPVDSRAVSKLLELAKEDNIDLRWTAIFELIEMARADNGLIPGVLETCQLPDRDGYCRQLAYSAVAQAKFTPDAVLIRQLTKALQHHDAIVRIGAANVLGSFGLTARSAVPALICLLRDRDPDVRDAARTALGRIGPAASAAVPALMRQLHYYRGVWIGGPGEALAGIGAPAVPQLIQAMRQRPSPGVWTPEYVLMQMGPAAATAVERLVEMLQGNDRTLRSAALGVLDRIGPSAAPAVPVLAKLRRDSDSNQEADEILIQIGQSAVDVFAADLNDNKHRLAAVEALGRIGPPARKTAPALIRLLTYKDRKLRFAAAGAIASITQDAEAVMPVVEEMTRSDDANTRCAAVNAARKIALADKRDLIVPLLRKALNDSSLGVRFEAARCVLAVRGAAARETLPVLIEMLGNEHSAGASADEAARGIILILGRAGIESDTI
jgi:HEAT repeat protein